MTIVLDGTLGITTPAILGDSIATQAEAEAGTNNTRVMTPLRVEQHMSANALGWGQTWQDVSGSRAGGTSYRNTTGRPIVVSIRATSSSSFRIQVSTDDATWVDVGGHSGTGVAQATVVVPNDHYYRTQGMGSVTSWAELR